MEVGQQLLVLMQISQILLMFLLQEEYGNCRFWWNLEQRVNERSQDDTKLYDVVTNVNIGKSTS